MSDAPIANWKPSPELLAAFADGELDRRDDAVELRARVEEWLGKNPQADLAGNRRLKELLDRTAPTSPSDETWRDVIDRVEKRPEPFTGKRSMSTRWFVGAAAAAACVVWAVLLASNYWREPVMPFAVATDRDVEILHVEGDGFNSIVVGRLPLSGVLELAETGEVASESPMDSQGRPMFRRQAKAETED